VYAWKCFHFLPIVLFSTVRRNVRTVKCILYFTSSGGFLLSSERNVTLNVSESGGSLRFDIVHCLDQENLGGLVVLSPLSSALFILSIVNSSYLHIFTIVMNYLGARSLRTTAYNFITR
jgi:hypothetical protein